MSEQQLFQINKRINQIKKNLFHREEKAQQWDVPYDKILYNIPINYKLSCTNGFRNSMKDNQNKKLSQTFCTLSQRKNYFQKKVKQSRKKIKQHHNELKQLQQLQVRKTKLRIKKQPSVTKKQPSVIKKQASVIKKITTKSQFIINQKLDKTSKPHINSIQKPNQKRSSTTFNSNISKSLQFASTLPLPLQFSNQSQIKQINKIRSYKEKSESITGLKVQKMIQIYQDAKLIGNEQSINQLMGVGIGFTPYMQMKKKWRTKKQSKDMHIQMQTEFLQDKSMSKQKFRQASRKSTSPRITFPISPSCKSSIPISFQKILCQKSLIYCSQTGGNEVPPAPVQRSHRKEPLSIFEKRLKNLLEQSQKIANKHLEQNQQFKKDLYDEKKKVKANRSYKSVFGLMSTIVRKNVQQTKGNANDATIWLR